MISDLISGASCFLRGIALIKNPGLRRFVLIPLTVNILIFAAAVFIGASYYNTLTEKLLPKDISWWYGIIEAAVWLIFTLIIMLVSFFTFNLTANFIAAPFNSVLSENVDRHLTGRSAPEQTGFRNIASSILPSLAGELKKLFYFISIGSVLLPGLLIPGINLIIPLLWGIFTSWLLAIEYMAYPMENNGLYFSDVKALLKKNRAIALGFGLTVMLAGLVPVVNLIVMPAAVTGATILWNERLCQHSQ